MLRTTGREKWGTGMSPDKPPGRVDAEPGEDRASSGVDRDGRLAARITRRVGLTRIGTRPRLLLAAGAIGATIVVLASVGGISTAASKGAGVVHSTKQAVHSTKQAVKPGKPKVVEESPAKDEYGQEKVTICHGTGSGKSVTISISRSALPAHLRHGDTIGACSS
jgi:hypothetical protein